MPAWSNHQVQIYGYGSSITIGPLVGTITRIIAGSAEGVNNLDEEGRGSFKISGADTPSLILCQEYRIARVTAVSSVSGNTHEIACFIIRDITPEVIGRQVVYTISGPDLVGNIKWGNLGYNVISNGAGGASTTPVADTLTYSDKGWTVVNHGTAPNGGVFVASGESAYAALSAVLQQMNAHYSFNLYNNPSFTLHVWYEFTATNGTGFDALTCREADDPSAYYADPSVAIITNKNPIRVIKERQEVVSRAFITGAGMGTDRRTITEAQGLVTVPALWEVFYSDSWIRNRNMEENGNPVIWTTKQFPAYEPSDPDDETAVQTNAVALLNTAITWMSHRTQPIITYYEIPNLIVHANIVPGQLVHVTYNRSSPVDSGGGMNTTEIIDLDDDFIVLGIKHRLGPGGVRYTTLLVGDTPKQRSGGLDIMAEKLKELEEGVRHTNAPSGAAGPPSGESSYLWATGSGPVLSGNLLVDPLVTIDGVDISAHAADSNAHHDPGTLSATTNNVHSLGVEYHAIDASSNPGPQVYLLKTDEGGRIVLVRADLDSLVLTDRTTAQQYNIFLDNGQMFIEPIN